MQDKAKLGKRYTCFKCGCKFYDLNKAEPVCPKCGADQTEDPTPDPRVAVMSRYKNARAPVRATPTPAKDDETDDFDLDDDDDDDDVAADDDDDDDDAGDDDE